jgi:hypothetical protein
MEVGAGCLFFNLSLPVILMGITHTMQPLYMKSALVNHIIP